MDAPPRTCGLSGDLGWNEADDERPYGFHSSLLLVASSAYFGAVWLLSGLQPLALVASCIRRCRGGDPMASTLTARSTQGQRLT